MAAPAEVQRDLLTGQDATPRPRRLVRPVSRAGYAIGREQFKGRAGNVLRWLAAFWNRHTRWPMSEELADWGLVLRESRIACAECRLLYVRRGLSDLGRKGEVRSIQNGQRRSARRRHLECETWAI